MRKEPWGTLACTPWRVARSLHKGDGEVEGEKEKKGKISIGGEMKTPAQLAPFNDVIALYIHEPVGECFVTET